MRVLRQPITFNKVPSCSKPALTLAGANKPLVILRSLAMTIPSFAKIPTHVPALLMASMAYSTYKSKQANVREGFDQAFPLNQPKIYIPGGDAPRGRRLWLRNRNDEPLSETTF